MRYRKLFGQYKNKKAVSCIWYIVKDTGIKNTIITQWNAVRSWSKPPDLFISIFDELKESPYAVDLYLPDGDIRKLCHGFKIHPVLTPERKIEGNSVQGVCNLRGEALGGATLHESQNNQELISNQNLEKSLPSAVDPSPPTLNEEGGEGATATGTEEVGGMGG